MATVFSFLLQVAVTEHNSVAQEKAVTIGVLHMANTKTMTHFTFTSMVVFATKAATFATTVRVYALL